MIPGETKGRLVLIADDDPSMRLVASAVLRHGGFSVIEASNGESAVQLFCEQSPNLVLLDVEMPVVDGYRACAEIRARPSGHNVPIVMVTGREDTESIDRAYDVGATDFIAKPINWPLLEHRLRYIIRGADTLHALGASESENRALLEAIPDLIFIIRRDGLIDRYLSTTPALGHAGPEALVGRNIRDVLSPQAAARVVSCIQRTLATGEQHSCEFESASMGGSKRYYESRYVPHRGDQALVIMRDKSDRKQAEEKIHRLAYYDSLTGLPNRQLFLNELENALEEAQRHSTMMATLYADLDRFKRINDTLGHGVGDAVLQSVAMRLAGCVRDTNATSQAGPGAKLARLGGDEFVILLTRLTKESDAIVVAQRIREVLSKPFTFSDHEFVVTPSIGIATYPKHGDSIIGLLKAADAAMYQAKATGRNKYRVYVNAGGSGLERLDIEGELRRALEHGELDVYYQPKFDSKNLSITGAEALVRWNHPERGTISPETFISLAEETGLIIDVDSWVARTVIRQLGVWRRLGLPAVPVAINLSGQEFCHRSPVKFLEEIVKANRIDPRTLELEITENVLMSDIRAARTSLATLKGCGFRLAVDDFGTGYSSLSYLKRLPLDTLKIDRSFIRDINNEQNSDAICAAIISMGHDLGLNVVAEGVESHEQLAFLRGRGCDQVQGFLLSRPLEAEEFTELLGDTGDAPFAAVGEPASIDLRAAS